MKACVLEGINNLVYKEVSTPVPKACEVLLKIKACGICSSDFSRVFHTGTYNFPTVLGHEIAGEIVQVGLNVDTNLIGCRAVVFPLLPCQKCHQCTQGNYALCSNYNYFGSRCDGGFAEYLSVPLWNIRIFDDDIPYEIAALVEPAAVAWHAVAKARIQPNETVFISGSGTIAILCGIWARNQGADVYLTVRNDEKAELLSREWSLKSINIGRADDVSLNRPDVVIECVGTPESIQASLEFAKTTGRVVLVGNPSENINFNKSLYWKILRSELTVVGVWNSIYPNEWESVLTQLSYRVKEFTPLITHKFPLSDGLNAFKYLVNNKGKLLKAVFTNE